MKFLFSYAICCVLTTSIQAYIIIINEPDPEKGKTTVDTDTNYSDLHAKERYCQDVSSQDESNKVIAEDYNSKRCSTDHPRPLVSPSDLMRTFQSIYKKIGIFPDKINSNRSVHVKNVADGLCLTMTHKKEVTRTEISEWACIVQYNQLIYLDHVGDGYVSLLFESNLCIGAGHGDGSLAFVSSSEDWCKNSHTTHHWAIIQKGDYVIFQQRGTEKCLTSRFGTNRDFVGTKNCSEEDSLQRYQICDEAATKCWP